MAGNTQGIGYFTAENIVAVLRAVPQTDGTYAEVVKHAREHEADVSKDLLGKWVSTGRRNLKAGRRETAFARFADHYDRLKAEHCTTDANRHRRDRDMDDHPFFHRSLARASRCQSHTGSVAVSRYTSVCGSAITRSAPYTNDTTRSTPHIAACPAFSLPSVIPRQARPPPCAASTTSTMTINTIATTLIPANSFSHAPRQRRPVCFGIAHSVRCRSFE